MKNLAGFSIDFWIEELCIELTTVRMHHPSKRLDYHHRASRQLGGPDGGAAVGVTISAPALAARENLSGSWQFHPRLASRPPGRGYVFNYLQKRENGQTIAPTQAKL